MRKTVPLKILECTVETEDIGVMAVIVHRDGLKRHQLVVLPEHQSNNIGTESMKTITEEACRLNF